MVLCDTHPEWWAVGVVRSFSGSSDVWTVAKLPERKPMWVLDMMDMIWCIYIVCACYDIWLGDSPILSQTTYLFWYMVSSPHLGTSNAQFVDLLLKALPLEVQKSLKQTSLGCRNWIQELEETGIRCVVLVGSSWYHERAPWFLGPNWTAWWLLLD